MRDLWKRMTTTRFQRGLILGVGLWLAVTLGIGIPYALLGQPWVWVYISLFCTGIAMLIVILNLLIEWAFRGKSRDD